MMTAESVMAARTKDSKPLDSFKGSLVLVGAGKMGGAMLEGWLARGLAPMAVTVIDPQPSKRLRELAKRGVTLNPPTVRGKASVLVVGVKPQDAASALQSLEPRTTKSSLVISIMAGRTLGFMQDALPQGVAIVRTIPNLPASIGRGITVAVANKRVSEAQKKTATELLAACGSVEWTTDEKLLDAVTAVSGSGPAYVFLLAEALTAAAIAAGLPAELSARLARETIAGAGELLLRSSLDAATLRKNVTSPNGTTAAALEVLMGPGGVETLMSTAVAKATRRSRELAG
jgi:pyrroline-5-carboxylate reductase